MRKNILNILLFSLPILIPLLFIVLIDPYNLINISKIIDDETKMKVINGSDKSFTKGNALWKILKFSRKPCPNLIIGDSDGYHIREQLVSELTGEEYFNFSISGASLETQINIFWFAAEHLDLQKVFFQLTFELCNQNASFNLVSYAQNYIDNPYMYFTDKDILVDSFRNIITKVTDGSGWVDHTYLVASKEKILGIINQSGQSLLNDYVYPEKYLNELKNIQKYCINHNIRLEFIILPVSYLMNKNIATYNLVQMRKKFYTEISSMGKTYDFLLAYQNSNNINHFPDFLHISQYIVDSIAIDIWRPKCENFSPN